ncbi:crotonase [Desulfosarcina widdelii]|uniref:Crotonase n=1 Tax=Desulfosarcina widdelii TaxID=947919 RepID=A0A5K7ZHQ2_9BACT|nr:enoyl-CoA hydratase/isomerase family protein [Desulfosarcina widdelii]BBO77844.1 crotonase [Desulfosarcina widdelii]
MDHQYIRAGLDDGIATIILHRKPLNVLNIAMMEEINVALKAFMESKVKLLVFRAEGKAFSAGVEVSEHMGGQAERMIEVFHGMFRLMDKLSVPSIAVINGMALGGGCELAIYCDMAIASEKATIGQPEIQVGVFPPIAALVMPHIMGRKKAMELLLSGDIISAREAMELGLINKVVDHKELEAEAAAFIKKFAKNSGIVLKFTRSALMERTIEKQGKDLVSIEDIYFNKLMKTHDANEGLRAFIDKRKPKWEDK